MIWSETADCVVATVERPPAPFTGRDEGYEGPTEEAALANARIIEAAPDLLDALRRITSVHIETGDEPWDRLIDIGRAAVAKATGTAPVLS